MSARAVRALRSLHRALAALAVIAFPASGLATALGYVTPGAFVAIAAMCSVTFGSALVALSREHGASEAFARRRTVRQPHEAVSLQ